MKNFMQAALCSAAAFAVVVSLSAQSKSGILQPQMAVGADGGTYVLIRQIPLSRWTRDISKWKWTLQTSRTMRRIRNVATSAPKLIS